MEIISRALEFLTMMECTILTPIKYININHFMGREMKVLLRFSINYLTVYISQRSMWVSESNQSKL